MQSKRAAIFLNGSYPDEEKAFYRAAVESGLSDGLVLAVDGALLLFDQLGLRPHLILGDFDSTPQELLDRFADIERIVYPGDKDQTDGELALRYLLERDFAHVDIFGAIDTHFETDQMLANLFSLALVKPSTNAEMKPVVRLVDHCQYIYFVEDGELALEGSPGQILSVTPLSPVIRLSLEGAKWDLDDAEIEFGSSRPLRNEFVGSRVHLRLSGRALVIHRHRND